MFDGEYAKGRPNMLISNSAKTKTRSLMRKAMSVETTTISGKATRLYSLGWVLKQPACAIFSRAVN